MKPLPEHDVVDAENGRSRGVIELLDPDEQEDLTVALAEGRERALEPLDGERRLRAGLRARLTATLARRRAELHEPSVFAGAADPGVARHREEPGGQIRVGRQLVRVGGELDPGFLERVLRRFSVLTEASQKAKESRRVARVHRVEGARVPRPQADEELFVGGRRHAPRSTHDGAPRDNAPARRGFAPICVTNEPLVRRSLEGDSKTMFELFVEGGYPMWFLLLAALAALASAGSFAARPTSRRLDLTRALGSTTLASILMGTAADVAAVGHHAPEYLASHPGETMASDVLKGLGESMSPAILGFSSIALVCVLIAFGIYRAEGDLA